MHSHTWLAHSARTLGVHTRSPAQLRGFEKVALPPGGKKLVTFSLADRWLSSWSTASHEWELNSGVFDVAVGGASDAIQLTGTMTVA